MTEDFALSGGATTGPGAGAPRHRISLRDHVVEVEIGAFQSERGATQRVRFNIVVDVRPPPAPIGDDVDRVLSYDILLDAVRAELAGERVNLLETLAERVAARILTAPAALHSIVRVEKLDRADGALGVEISRSREEPGLPPQEASQETPPPLVVFLAETAIHAPELTDCLDRLKAQPHPVILCVGPADTVRPRTAAPAAQRRIELLAIEQNAWVLAGRDPRCVVTATRAEIAWAARERQITVWAPSRMVLDAAAPPTLSPTAPAALAAWFAEEIGAARLLLIGAAEPVESDLEVRRLSLADAAAGV